MKIIIDGYNKSIHKKDNQIVIHEKDEILDSIKASKINDITIIGKGYVTFDALDLMTKICKQADPKTLINYGGHKGACGMNTYDIQNDFLKHIAKRPN